MDYRTLTKRLKEFAGQEPEDPTVIEIREDLYRLIPESVVIELIRKHHPDARITNTMLEHYYGESQAQNLTTDKTTLEIRRLNPADAVFESHTEYRLNNGDCVVISEQTGKRLNKLLGENPIILDYMKESAETFMDVVNELEE